MTKIKRMTYTKDNGDVSEREVIVVSAPKENYLVYDVSKLNDEERKFLLHYLDSIDAYRDETFAELTSVTGIRQTSLWRSFKPGGIEWEQEDEI
jgi:uncharacterized membrane protein YvbJ